ncbi:MAG: glycine cleavage system protein H [Verrucomicrobiales bacterium]|nr:glycine cleavage system protein H [Verrucomicrobiales bacterium]
MEYRKYKHSRFTARFPVEFRYSLSHYWMANQGDGTWRVGFSKFATRMLGELVEARYDFEVGDVVKSGQEIGYVEGFKAASDLFCVMDGEFAGGNPILEVDACVVKSSPYVDGWLYAVKGDPEESSVDVDGYIDHLDKLINKMQEEGY